MFLRGIVRRARQAIAVIAAMTARVRIRGPARVPTPKPPASPGATDPRLAETDPAIAAYVAARDPEWFAIEVEAPAHDARAAPAREPSAEDVARAAPTNKSKPPAPLPNPPPGKTEVSAPKSPDKPHAEQGPPVEATPPVARSERSGDVPNGVPGNRNQTGQNPVVPQAAAGIRFRAPAPAPRVEPTRATPPAGNHDPAAPTPPAAPIRFERRTPGARADGAHDAAPARAAHTDPSRGTEDFSARRRAPEPSPTITPRSPKGRTITPPFAEHADSRSRTPDDRAASPFPEQRNAPRPMETGDGPLPTGRAPTAEPQRSPWPPLPKSEWKSGGVADRARGSGLAWRTGQPDDALLCEQRST